MDNSIGTLFIIFLEIGDLISLIVLIFLYFNGIVSGDVTIIGGIVLGLFFILLSSALFGGLLGEGGKTI